MITSLDHARRSARRLAARARRRLSGEDGGFVLLESIIAISLITVIMAAIGVEYVSSLAAISRQRATQSAAQVANSTLEQARALRPSDLVAGRGATAVGAQFSAGAAIPSIAPWLQNMDQASDPNAQPTDGASATIPTCSPAPQGAAGAAQCTQKPGAVSYTVAQFIGTCWLVNGSSSSSCLPAAQKTASSVKYLRFVVSVGWTGSTCATGCYYVTSTLINADPDPTFKANQPPTAAPVIIAPGNQNDDIGDTVSLQLGLVVGTGVPGLSWAITSGTLPAGLSMSSGGLISGVPAGPTGTVTITVQVTDGYGRQDSTTFTWTIGTRPTVVAPPNQITAINTPVNLSVSVSCGNPPCTIVLNNPPPGLTIDPSTGVISGTPTTAGTTTTSVTVTDAAGNSVTSSPFTWSVLPTASTCPSSVTLGNGGFEAPTVAAGAGTNVGNGTTGMVWRTNNSNGQIEYWANGGNSTTQNGGTPIAAKDGSQWVEVNGSGMDTLYQDLTTTPGQVLQWSLWHRARNVTNNVNATDSIQVKMGSTTTQSAQVPTGSTSSTISDGASAWVQYTGTYTVPAGQTTTRFQVTAVATSSGSVSVGNFLDAVSVTGVPCLVSAVPPQSSTVNTAITPLQLTAAQGSGSYTWSNGGSLPAGLTITSSGLITGTPTSVGTTTAQVLLTDQVSGFQELVLFTWTVYAAPTITSPGNRTSSVGIAVTVPVTSTCANTPCSFSASGLPAGVTINTTTGTMSGTPTTAGTTSTTVTIRDAAGATASATFSWVVKPGPTITSPGTQGTTRGVPVSLTPPSTCPNSPCTYGASGLPAGLSINTGTGTISGTPTTLGTQTVTITIQDQAGAGASATFTWTIFAPPTITTPGNQTTSVGAPVNITVGSTCPNTPCTYTLNNPPGGLSMTGPTITGSPTTAGTFSSTVTVTDASGVSATTGTFTWTIKAAPTVTAPANQTTSVGATVNVVVTSSCDNAPCTYTLNNAPAGLSMSGSTIVGSPTTAGTVTSSITIRDNSGASVTSGSFTWTIKPASTIASPGAQKTTVGVAVNLALTTTCNYSPCTYALSGQPAGLTISNSGVITGTPTTAGTSSSVTASVTDAAGAVVTTSPFSWTIYARPTITTPANQVSTVNTALILPITSTCPNSPCSYALTGAPAGLTADRTTGRITGTPTATGTSSSVQVTVTDANNVAVSTSTFTWTITAAPSVTSPGNQSTVNNAAVSLTLTKSCPNAPCAYRLNGGPAGLTITSAGVVTGTVTSAPQTFSGVTVTVTDSSGATGTSASFTWTVTAPLAGRWTFDESSGSAAADSSGNAHPATLSGNYGKTGVDVQGANAVTLDGTSGTAASTSGPVLNTANSFTVSAWVKLSSTSGYSSFVSQSGTNVGGFFLQYKPDSNRFRFYKLSTDSTSSGGAAQSSLAAPVVGQWYQLTGVYDSTAGTISLFVNGVRQGTPVAAPGGFNATGNFVMGAANFGGLTNWTTGAIDDVRAYGSALSDDAVAQLAQAGYYRLDEGSGTTANDSSPNGANATLSGGTTWTTGIAGSAAAQFNGSNAVITSSSTVIDTSQSFSVSAWVKSDNVNVTGTAVSLDGTTMSAFALQEDGGKWAFSRPASDTAGATITYSKPSTDFAGAGSWYLLTGVYDSSAQTLTLYVNGTKQVSVSYTTAWKGTGKLVIGRGKSGGTAANYFPGAVDDVRAYQFALDQASVTALTNLAPPAPGTPSASAGASSATVSWTAPVDVNGSPVTGYVVTPYLDGVAQAPVTYNSTATSQTLTGLTTGGSYTFSVAAVNANGTSANSSVSAAVLPT